MAKATNDIIKVLSEYVMGSNPIPSDFLIAGLSPIDAMKQHISTLSNEDKNFIKDCIENEIEEPRSLRYEQIYFLNKVEDGTLLKRSGVGAAIGGGLFFCYTGGIGMPLFGAALGAGAGFASTSYSANTLAKEKEEQIAVLKARFKPIKDFIISALPPRLYEEIIIRRKL